MIIIDDCYNILCDLYHGTQFDQNDGNLGTSQPYTANWTTVTPRF